MPILVRNQKEDAVNILVRIKEVIMSKKREQMPENDHPSDLEIFANYPWAFGSNPVPLNDAIVVCSPERPAAEDTTPTKPRLTLA
jgi:hypothetical protein